MEREFVTLRFGTPRASEGDFDVVDAFTGGGAREAHASPGSRSGASAPGAVRLSRLTDDLEMLRSEVTALRMLWSSAAEQAPPAAGARARRTSVGEASEAGSPSPPPSPRRGLPTGDRVRLLAGAQGSAALPPRPAGAGEASARLLASKETAPAPAPLPRVLDMRVPALHRRAPGEAEAPLRLLQRPGAAADAPEPTASDAPLAPLSREAAQLKASFDAAVAATEARLRAALTEALRESTNLRLARAPHAAADAAAAAAHRDALALRNSATTAARPTSPPPSSGAEAHEEEEPRAVAEREDPFVPLWQWAGGRPARLADLYRDAEAAGAEALPRSRLAALVATLAPAADARALRYVAAVLDADGAGDAVPLASFVHAVREGASAGAAARADAHAGLERCLVMLRRSLDAQPEAWAFQFRCAPGGALSPAQVLAAACAVLPELTGRQRVLFAAAIYAEGSFGGPRHTFTLPQLMILAAPRAQRSRRSAALSAATPAPKPALPAPPAEPARQEELPRRPQPTEPPPERLMLARNKRANAEAAAAAAMAAAAAAAAAAGVVREELQRAQAARERAALEPPPPPLPLPLPSGTRAELSAAEAEEAAASAAPRPAAKAPSYALPPMRAAEEATESSDSLGYSSTDASTADVHSVTEATAAPVAHPSPAAKPVAPPVPDAERAKRSAARARSLLKEMQAAIGAAAADADALRGDIRSTHELLASTRTQLCAPSAAPPPFVQHQTWRR